MAALFAWAFQVFERALPPILGVEEKEKDRLIGDDDRCCHAQTLA